jgi:hypothetical protein
MEQMLVTSGLNELKLLDNRINRKIAEGSFVAGAKKASANVNGKTSKDKFYETSKAEFTSITDLIKRRNAIKSAIVRSNANTIVKIGDKEMTVAEAIERKDSIKYEQALLKQLEYQYSFAVNTVVKENTKVEEQVAKLLETAYGKDSKDKISETMYDGIAKPYKEGNEFALVDALDVEKVIKTMKDDIETFLSNVDSALQISNCVTMIEF